MIGSPTRFSPTENQPIMDPKPNRPQEPAGKPRPPMPVRALLAWFLLMALLVTVYQLATQNAAKPERA